MGIPLSRSMKLFTTVAAQSENPPAPKPLILTDEESEYPLGLYLEILEDPGGELTIDEVSSPEFDTRFIPSQEDVPNFGHSDSAYWVRLSLDNQARQMDEWLLEIGFANMHYVDLYTPLPGGNGFGVRQTGALRPVSTRDILYPRIVFALAVPTQSQQDYYLRFKNGGSMTLPLTLWAKDAFWNEAQSEQMHAWLFFGALSALLAYHLFLLFSLKDASYLFFVILLASLLLEELLYLGYFGVYIFPSLFAIKSQLHAFSLSLFVASILLFSDAFLEIKNRIPKLHTVNMGFAAVWGVIILLTPLVRYHILAVVAVPLALFSIGAVLVTGIVSWREGFHPVVFFMAAWLGMLATIILLFLVRIGIAPSTPFNENIYHTGLIWMAVCWSIALADRINLLKNETESANRALRSSENKLSQILEGLPLGVVVYGKDRRPSYANRRTAEILSNPTHGIEVDTRAGRTLEDAVDYFSLQKAGSMQAYPIEDNPIHRALQGEPASVDDIEANLGDRRVPLEIWASPVKDDLGNVESALVVLQDITGRKLVEAELAEYRQHLEALVEQRTEELSSVNEQLEVRLEWFSALNLINQAMARSADFSQIYEKILEIVNHLFVAQGSFISEWEAGRRQLKILAHSCRSNLHPDLVGTSTTLPDGILSDSNLEKGKLIHISRDQLGFLSGPMTMHIEITKIQGLMLVPLILREQFFGFLGLETIEDEKVITSEESNLLGIFSIDIAQVLEDSRQYMQTKELIAAEERNRLARDLHDSVTQVLFSMTLLADVLPQIWRRDPEQGLQRLDKLQRLTRGALAEMRTLLIELRPSAIVNTPLGDLLALLTEATASRSGLLFQLYLEHIPVLPEAVQTNFYRIAQEALNNVIKHAQAKKVVVSLSETLLPADSNGGTRREVMLVIQDDGVGYASGNEMSTHMGIGIMRERAKDIQASFSLESQPGYGTQMTLTWCTELESV